MNIYRRTSWQKWSLGILAIIIMAFSVWYTSDLANRLAEVEENNMRFYAIAQDDLASTDEEDNEFCDFFLHLEILQSNTTIPVVIANEYGEVDWGRNWGNDALDEDKAYLKRELEELINDGVQPIQGYGSKLYFGESIVLEQLRFFPYIQFLLIGVFVIFGYFGINSARRSEQNRVWVGMAKETAHQLGTPISAIVAWIEHLKILRPNDDETMEIASELRNDVQRLELIADRFSKIGSAPKLESINIFQELDICREYMQKRASRKVVFEFPDASSESSMVHINPHLFDWVIENLLRNALDAMGGRGTITAKVFEDKKNVIIEITDSGKGIAQGNYKRVFEPGFTTKKRGWGLGLSLAKRIIEDYHKGKIFVKKSEEGRGTTFSIQLPMKG